MLIIPIIKKTALVEVIYEEISANSNFYIYYYLLYQ